MDRMFYNTHCRNKIISFSRVRQELNSRDIIEKIILSSTGTIIFVHEPHTWTASLLKSLCHSSEQIAINASTYDAGRNFKIESFKNGSCCVLGVNGVPDMESDLACLRNCGNVIFINLAPYFFQRTAFHAAGLSNLFCRIFISEGTSEREIGQLKNLMPNMVEAPFDETHILFPPINCNTLNC